MLSITIFSIKLLITKLHKSKVIIFCHEFSPFSFSFELQVVELVPESQAYMDLLAFENKLDSTIMRKRLDIQEALKRPIKVTHLCIAVTLHLLIEPCITRISPRVCIF